MSAKKALIMAGGKGIRLSLIDAPKPLVRVGNKPMIMWAIEQLQEVGVTDIYVAAGDWGAEIQTFLLNEPGISAHVQLFAPGDETKRTMNDVLQAASDVIGGDFYIVMSDLVIERNPYTFLDALAPLQDDEIVTLVDERADIYEASGARSATVLDTDQVKRIIRDTDEEHPHELGVYYVGKDAAKELTKVTVQEGIEKMHDVLQAFADKQKLRAAKLTDGEWFDINTPATHVKAEIFVRERHHALHTVGGIAPLEKLSLFTEFHRPKNMQSDIFVKRGVIKHLDTVQIIPEELSGSSHIILTDDMVDKHYGEMVESGLQKAGYRVKKIVVPAGEESKNITLFAELADEILAFGIDKQSSIIGLGGGVVNNIAGYLASSLYRGITLIHVPTSSMAQVDAAIDFKQAVNTTYGKNLLGAYHPATNIVIDPEVLLTLDERHLRNGLSESLKHAITQDKDFLQYMMDNADNIWDVPFLEEVVRKTITHKVPLLNGDVHDDYNEMLPQYGHSLGHAVEHLSGYDLLHGEAIAIGMCLSAEVGLLLGICSEEMVQLHRDVFSAYKLPIVVPDTMTADDIINKIAYDKHYVKGNPQMAIVKDVGDVYHENGVYGIPIEYSLIRKAIEKNISR